MSKQAPAPVSVDSEAIERDRGLARLTAEFDAVQAEVEGRLAEQERMILAWIDGAGGNRLARRQARRALEKVTAARVKIAASRAEHFNRAAGAFGPDAFAAIEAEAREALAAIMSGDECPEGQRGAGTVNR